tara:strand:+ start:91 stop:465 length:375 start_codon:yes stop_codon:yes gene_type:complete
MKNQTLIFTISFLLLSLIGCNPPKIYKDNHSQLSIDNIQKITIEIKTDSTKTFTITDKQIFTQFVTDLNNSKVNGPWKGATWDKIIIHYIDGKKILSTNGKVFGEGSSGFFYDLNKKYKHYWRK